MSDQHQTQPIPTDAMMELMSPDGYYSYLKIDKTKSIVEYADQVKKSYRKLSLKHHPDKATGDADTFRLLNRAHKVLTNPKLKQQYDILGMDLHEEAGEGESDGTSNSTDEAKPEQTASEGIIQEIASQALTGVLQLGVRTSKYILRYRYDLIILFADRLLSNSFLTLFSAAMLCIVSLLVVRTKWLMIPALGFLTFLVYSMHKTAQYTPLDMTGPFILSSGLLLMYSACSWSDGVDGFFRYWMGESIIIAMFSLNSLPPNLKTPPVGVAIIVAAILLALWFRGRFWNYGIVIGLELFLALFIALAFPVMEMLLEAILQEKLKKVGDMVRTHHAQMERYYQSKQSWFKFLV